MITLQPKQPAIAQRLLDWFDQYGRKDLPWQREINPYRVWISEIMLQQTQVTTVIPYFNRFIAAFPDVDTLSAATEDEVLKFWSGLGYYARARNLHRSAQIISRELAGNFPDSVDALCALPGIGRSTAGAIVSIAGGGRAPILDGNVKRVLARHFAIDGWPGKRAVAEILWDYAEANTPEHRVADYTQAIMDLGATLCTRSNPDCQRCPLIDSCKGAQIGTPERYPGKKPPRSMPTKNAFFAVITDAEGAVLLEKRPPTGIWGNLWSLPQSTELSAVEALAARFGVVAGDTVQLPVMRHVFSHFRLDITPVSIGLRGAYSSVADGTAYYWHNSTQPLPGGIPAPVAKLLSELGHLPAFPQGETP